MLAKYLKAGQKFTRRGSSHECTAIGITDYCGDVYFTEDLGDGLEVDCLDENARVTLVEEKPAASYADRQAAWVEEHGLKIGSKVKVTRKAEDQEDGWPVGWAPSMDSLVGNEYEIVGLDASGGVQLPGEKTWKGKWNLPYFVLEPVKPSVDPGEGYQLLGPDEICQEGDEHYTKVFSAKWMPVESGIGMRVEEYAATFIVCPVPRPVRRKIELVKPSVDPGDGYRLLGPDEATINGDEFYIDNCWSPSNNWCSMDGKQSSGFEYQRKIEPVKTSVDPGEGYRLLGPDEKLLEGDEAE